MGKQSGLGANCYVDQYDLSGDVGSLSRINTARGVLPATGIDKSAMERLHSHRDGGFEFTSFFNKAAGQQFPALSPRPTADRIASYLHRTTIGASAASCVAKQINFDANRGEDGSLVWTTAAESNGYGLEWGKTLTAGKRTDTGATNGSAVDFEASTAFGAQFYLHVFAFSGTDVTISIEEDDNSGFTSAAAVTGGAFTQVTGVTKERIQTGRALTVERYLRAVTATSGGFASVTFAVIAVKNTVSTVF